MMLGQAIFRGSTNWGQMFEIIAALGAPSIEEVHAMKPGQGCQRLQENVEKLAQARRKPTSWRALLPAYAGQDHALELPAKLLVWLPEARLHPAKALLLPIFAELRNLDQHTLPPMLFSGFSDEELSSCSAEVRLKFKQMESKWKSKMIAPEAAADMGVVTKKRRLLEESHSGGADAEHRRLLENAGSSIPQVVTL